MRKTIVAFAVLAAVTVASPARADSFAFFLGLPGFSIYAADPPPPPVVYHAPVYHPVPVYVHDYGYRSHGWGKHRHHHGHHKKCWHGR